jgi:serine protease Do
VPLGLDVPLRRGARAYHPGFPQGHPGEAASRLLGRENLVVHGRGARTEPVLVWAEVGRTDTLKGTLAGLSGSPALDSAGRVIGVTVAEAPRRGRIYTTAPETLTTLLGARRRPSPSELRAQRADHHRELRPRGRRPAPRPARGPGGLPEGLGRFSFGRLLPRRH